MGVNSKYKDSLFSWLFSDPDTLRELYGAIEGVHLDPATPITINTLEGILYMELTAKVYNINKDHNNPIVRGCQRLSWYSAFIAKVRECEETVPDKETAMKMAINYCIKHDIMKEFFEANASEVVNMLLTEWNWDDAKEVWQEEAREEGEKIGENKVLELMEQGYTPEQIKTKLSTRTETAGK
ncbi:hypothetical protein FACS1894110_03140 [Spirochaetia bacterium]|nr:hypothetical protein FACS1894110_03140 [Spirochaetia bacterium]